MGYRVKVRKDGISYTHLTDASKLLGVSEPYLRSKCDKGGSVARLIGGAWYLPEEALLKICADMQKRVLAKAIKAEREANEAIQATMLKATHAGRIVGREIQTRRAH
jgi:hypothetical protein